ncbi:acidic mammalian chitinase-like isoform X2 [Haliotis rubra]|uniref:acidic mammalian chitinase-like isoform X2 n=1 Tax=Haliotis rubra TaxID=36100 RepID=UPI001EE5D335|nr:acidic mammalian chitinase-like isoform X2 [Haliotis rubra]
MIRDCGERIWTGVWLCTFIAACCVATAAGGKTFVCYYQPSARVPIARIPADLCTHVVYAFAEASKNGIIPAHTADLAKFSEMVALKKVNPNLKVLVSLQNGFPAVVDGGVAAMETFAKGAGSFLRKLKLDGVDFDWEFPSRTQKDGYMKLISIFRKTINDEAKLNGTAPLLLTMALSNNRYIAGWAYDMSVLTQNIDFATVMTYDFHVFNAKHDNVTGYNSPLVAPKGEIPYLSTEGMLNFYMKAGLERSKILMGVPAYGRSYTLADSSKHGLHAPAVARGAPGPAIHVHGVYIYQGICMALKSGATRVWDATAGVPYLYNNTAWVSYDDEQSIKGKCNGLCRRT